MNGINQRIKGLYAAGFSIFLGLILAFNSLADVSPIGDPCPNLGLFWDACPAPISSIVCSEIADVVNNCENSKQVEAVLGLFTVGNKKGAYYYLPTNKTGDLLREPCTLIYECKMDKSNITCFKLLSKPGDSYPKKVEIECMVLP